jgi:hypothetical protein
MVLALGQRGVVPNRGPLAKFAPTMSMPATLDIFANLRNVFEWGADRAILRRAGAVIFRKKQAFDDE